MPRKEDVASRILAKPVHPQIFLDHLEQSEKGAWSDGSAHSAHCMRRSGKLKVERRQGEALNMVQNPLQ